MHGGLYIFLWWYLVTLWTHVPHVPLSLCLCTRIWQLMFFAREPFFASFRLRFYVFWFRKRSLKQNPLEHWSVQDSVHAQPNAFCKIYHHKIKSKHALQLAQILCQQNASFRCWPAKNQGSEVFHQHGSFRMCESCRWNLHITTPSDLRKRGNFILQTPLSNSMTRVDLDSFAWIP